MARPVLLLLAAAAFLSLLSPGEAQFGGSPYFPYYGGGPYVGTGAGGGGGIPKPINCSELVCGTGTCNSSYSSSRNGSSYSYSYSYNYTGSLCECKQGWSPFFSSYQSSTPYRPCIWPKCNFTTQGCNATANPQPPPTDPTVTDPCAWMFCGEGKCESKSDYEYQCKCRPGFYNLFNNSAFPCFSECMLSPQCKSVGASFSASALADAGGAGNGTGGSGGGGASPGSGGGGDSGGKGTSGTAGAPTKLLGFVLMAVGFAMA